MPIINSRTGFTSHVTAPNKPAVTSVNLVNQLSVVASPTAQEVAPVPSLGRLVAHSPRCAQNTQLHVWIAVVWRAFDEHQRVFGYLNAFLFFSPYAPLPSVVHHLHSIVVLGFQVVADFGEVWNSFPTCLDSARARNPMATALTTHKILDCLQTNNREARLKFYKKTYE